MKTCADCGKKKKLVEFYTHPNTRDGRQHICKKCSIKRVQRWTQRNYKKRQAYLSTYRKKNHARIYERRITSRFGMSLVEYNARLQAQGGVCAICRRPPRGRNWRRLVIDHCHASGKVRDLLCDTCNRALGLLHEDQQILKGMMKYLRKHQSTSPT